MDPEEFRSKMSGLAFGNVMAAAARNYQKELLAEDKGKGTTTNEEVDLDELMDDPELERLHAERISALKKEAEKRQSLKQSGHGDYREITEGDFLGEVTHSEKVICHFYHQEFYRCKIMDKHLKALAPLHINTKFIKIDAEECRIHLFVLLLLWCFSIFWRVFDLFRILLGVKLIDHFYKEKAPFFVAKLAVKILPCVIMFRNGIAADRIVGFHDLGEKDDFSTKTLESLLKKKGVVDAKEVDEDGEDIDSNSRRSVRSSVLQNSDSD